MIGKRNARRMLAILTRIHERLDSCVIHDLTFYCPEKLLTMAQVAAVEVEIKRKFMLWRESWMNPPLGEIRAILREEVDS